jgi:prephenate dehydrogenase
MKEEGRRTKEEASDPSSFILHPSSFREPVFPTVAVVGFGFIGGSLGLAVKRRWPVARVIAVDEKPVLETALQMQAADIGGESLAVAADATLVVLAAPVRANIAVLAALPDFIAGSAVVTDVGSTKAETVEAARMLPSRLHFVGGHPLAGAALGGIAAARAELFDGQPWLLTPDGSSDPQALALLREFVEGVGGLPVELTATEHDRTVAFLSHLPQLAVTALMHVVGESVGEKGLALAGRGLRDTTRLASSPVGIWRDIAATNPEQVCDALDAFIEVLRRFRGQAENPDAAFDEIFESAARWKQKLDSH